MDRLKKWEIGGAIATIVIGSLLHFVFNWSGQAKIVGLFGAVNESTWEHLKLAFWPTFFFGVIEFFVFGREVKNFFLATFAKLFSAPIIIVILFYSWLAFFFDNFIWDISIFVVAVILSYYIGYKILKIDKAFGWEKFSAVLIIVGLVKFSLFTFFPPKTFLTRDPISGGYGIQKQASCTLEAKICPDGTAVGRTGPNCEFAPCP